MIKIRIRRALYRESKNFIEKICQKGDFNLIRLGTSYGGWFITSDLKITDQDTIISCGAGEDISFDLELQEKFDCRILIIDPTPRAISHYEKLVIAAKNGKSIPIDNNEDNYYDIEGVQFNKLHFINKALWNEKTTVKFYMPYINAHVSHSIINYQEGSKYLKVKTTTLDSIIHDYSINSLKLIKLDIEGAEIEVIIDMMNKNILPEQIAVEFDEINYPNKETASRIKKATKALLSKGYQLIHIENQSDCLFVRKFDLDYRRLV